MAPLLAAWLALQAPLGLAVLRPAGGPEIVLDRQPVPLVSLRLSAPVPPTLPDGVVELLQELARPAAEAAAQAWGAEVTLRREPGHAVLAVTGPAVAFDALAALLREAAAEPVTDAGALVRARARAEDRLHARREQTAPRLRDTVWRTLAGTGPSEPDAAGPTLAPEGLRRARAELYHSSRLRLVVVGGVFPEAVLAAFAAWPAGSVGAVEPASAPAAASAPPDPPPPAWAALALPVHAAPAALAAAAELVGRHVGAEGSATVQVEGWQGEGWQALVLIGPAPASELRRWVGEAAAAASADAVAEAAAAVRDTLLLEARSAPGRAEIIGRVADATGEPDALLHLLAGLDRVSLHELGVILAAALAAPPVVVEPVQ
jgi:hypothetical protein